MWPYRTEIFSSTYNQCMKYLDIYLFLFYPFISLSVSSFLCVFISLFVFTVFLQ
jgi:hypothetical protein